MADITTSKWNNNFLKSMSYKTDSYAESIINDIVLGEDFGSFTEQLDGKLIYNTELGKECDVTLTFKTL